jgi:hypothetical protein
VTARTGFWREPGGEKVDRNNAEELWASAALGVLERVSTTYHATIQYGELAREVQGATAVRTNLLVQNWIGAVLGRVARTCHAQGLPHFTALVVHKDDGKVGEGYKEVLGLTGHGPISDEVERENHAAISRLGCYVWAGSAPADGGRPALSPALSRARTWAAKQRLAAKPVNVCPTCQMQLPATGVCDTCAEC